MDAAKSSFTRTAFLLAFALLVPASAFSQPAFSLNGNTSGNIAISLFNDQSTPVNVASTGAQITYSASVNYQGDSNNPSQIRWLCLNPTDQQSGCNDSATGIATPDTLDVQIGLGANNVEFPAGTHSAVITLTATTPSGVAAATITVSYTNGSSNPGGGAIVPSTTSLSQSSLFCTSGICSVSFQLNTSSATPVAYTLTSNAGWLTILNPTGTVSSGNSATINLTLNGSGYPQTTLTGAISIAGSSNTVTVFFGNGVNVSGSGGGSGSLTANPNPVLLSYTTNSGFFPSATVSLNGTQGLGFTATVRSTSNWLLVDENTQITGTLPATLSLSADSNVQNIVSGDNAIVTITAFDNTTIQLQVNLTVNGANASGISVSPNPISLSTPFGGSSVSQSVTIGSTIGGPVSATLTGTGLQITQQPVSGSVPAGGSTTMTITGNPSGLSSQTYLGTLSITVGGATQNVSVSFTVGSSTGGGGTVSSLAAGPQTMSFVYEPPFGTPTQSQQVYLAGSGNYTASVSTNNGGGWLAVSSAAGALPAQGAININASGLSAGTYNGSVSYLNTSSGTTAVVSVSLQVTGTAAITASPGDFVFNYINGTSSIAQFSTVSFVTTDNSTLPITGTVSNPSATPWLTFVNNATSTGGSVTVNATGLANGLYTGFVTLTGNAPNSPINVPVVLNVVGSTNGNGGNTGGVLTLGQSSLTFTPLLNGNSVSQQLTVSASTVTSYTATASTSNGGSTWLSISPSGGSLSTSTNTSLTVTANPAGLVAGTYNGQINLVANGVTQSVPVTMIVGGTSGSGGNLSISVNGSVTTSPSFSFTTQTVGGSVNSQAFTISAASGSSFNFTASLSGSSCGWVTLSPIAQNQNYQESSPQAVTVGATTAGLASGTYNCTLTLTPTGGTAVTIPLTLTVIGQPTVAVTTTGPLSFSYAAGAATPATQSITISGSGSGPAAFTATATTTTGGNWLSVTPASGTVTNGSTMPLTVSVNPANLTAGTYNGTISVNAGTGATGSGTVQVALTVTAPSPNITMIVNGASFINGAVSPGEFVSIFGTQLGPATPLGASIGANGNVTTSQGNVQVFFGGTAAPLTYVSAGQINCTVPYEVAGLSTIGVQVKYLGQPSNSVTLNVQPSAPGIFSSTGSGTGQAAVLNFNNTPNTSGNPAAKGTVIQIFMTGEGVTSPAGTDGGVTANSTTIPVLPIAVKIGGQPATVVFAGEAPGIIAGVLQLNVMVPPTVSSGTNSLAVTIGNNVSQANLTIQVQ